MQIILGVETSCDETAVALVEQADGQVTLRAQAVASQIAQHRPYGGVVPEVATREHLRNLPKLVPQVWAEAQTKAAEIDAVAVTSGPGLAPALLVGLSYARGLGLALGKPCYLVNHLEGHLLSPFAAANRVPVFPFIGLIVSGGHTLLLRARGWDDYEKLGGTVDDAAGEVLDKVARLLGLGYPGGPEIERWARLGNPEAHAFPQSFPERDNFNFSFSGLKTSVRYFVEKHPEVLTNEKALADVCASFQAAVVAVLVRKAWTAAERWRVPVVAASGGVLCNAALRSALEQSPLRRGRELLVAPGAWCTDNAAMIAMVAAHKLAQGIKPKETGDLDPSWQLGAATV
jgi:N6-L-threonylcarbamoyladenine synthase